MNNFQGWGPPDNTSVEDRLTHERRGFDRLYSDMPVLAGKRSGAPLTNLMTERWEQFQSGKGRGAGSFDLTLVQEFTWGKGFDWLPQIIGSCVASNTLRPWVTRSCYQIGMRGDGSEFLGRNEFSPFNLSFYAPFSYGEARRRANMKGATSRDDGLYCEAMYNSLTKCGVLPCSTPVLIDLLKRLNVAGERDFPEPQNAQVYRQFGNWQHLDELIKYCDFRLLETQTLTTADELLAAGKEFKPASVCSPVAIRKIGKHKDGFDIHARDPNDTWMHCMSFQGFFLSSDGKVFQKLCNKSWGPERVYNVPIEEVDAWFKRKILTVQTIGEIDLPKSVPFT
jgi:hypothetical protein